MKTPIVYIFLTIAAMFVLSSCTPKQQQPQTVEDYTLTESVSQCKNSATDMNDAPHNSNNPFWNSYFEMCMSSKGYTKADYKHLWY